MSTYYGKLIVPEGHHRELEHYGAKVDSELIAGIIAGAVGVIALFVQGRQNRVATAASAEQNRLTLESAKDANTATQTAAARSEVWARFHWAVEAVSQSSNPKLEEAGWVVLASLAHDPSASAQDRGMMFDVMAEIARLNGGSAT